MLEVVLTDRHRRGYAWEVCDLSGKILLAEREKPRRAAKYAGDRAFFQLLATDPKSIDLERQAQEIARYLCCV
ncbi:hypothetical protein BraRD5C2_39930 [Bradyrhizobium sp. RD5-C2]|nr:hypothetical protein BraRD5C2_39930 [Bradyrhizobium sp. RD5-C2]